MKSSRKWREIHGIEGGTDSSVLRCLSVSLLEIYLFFSPFFFYQTLPCSAPQPPQLEGHWQLHRNKFKMTKQFSSLSRRLYLFTKWLWSMHTISLWATANAFHRRRHSCCSGETFERGHESFWPGGKRFFNWKILEWKKKAQTWSFKTLLLRKRIQILVSRIKPL